MSKAVGFADTYRFDDGATVTVDPVEHAKLGVIPQTEDPNAKEGDPYLIFNTTTTNGTTMPLDFVCDAILLLSDGTRAYSVAPEQFYQDLRALDPEDNTSIAFGFIVPADARGRVQLNVTISIDPLRVAAFSGELPL